MPRNEVETLLADTCDYFQDRLREDRVLRIQLGALIDQGQRPSITRGLGPELPGAGMVIVVGEPTPVP